MDLSLILTLVILVLVVLFVLGLISPKKFASFGGGPHRGKAFVYLGVAFVLLIVLGSMADNILEKQIAETPEEIYELELAEKELTAFPDYLPTLINLEDLNLEFNQITEINAGIKDLDNLTHVKLSHNPITVLPTWLLEMEGLENLNLFNTEIDSSSLPVIEKLVAKGVYVDYDETHITGKDLEQKAYEEATKDYTDDKEAVESDDHTESFWDFAKRRLLSDDDTQRRIYGKGEIYYYDDIEQAVIDSLGVTLTDLGLFGEEKEASVKLEWEDDAYLLKVVTIMEEAEDINEEQEIAWIFIRSTIKVRVFPEDDLIVQLCDRRLEVLKEIGRE